MEEYTIMVYEIESEEEIITKLETLLNQEEIVEVKEKKGKVTTRNLKERIKSFRREGNMIEMEIINTSPNSYLDLAGIEQQDVKIKRLGYKINN